MFERLVANSQAKIIGEDKVRVSEADLEFGDC